ncbi:microcystin degradation protein MlrC [Stella humosa]|uniref:Microcystinase C n=1 Tax=Stella humosa TaxID=94 RepID=A0A3N1KSQ6_9PROT|nr:M81 family metallopeptidase [Stella humosa]ROP83621.1 microcystin degradation protein MlrC [Stella humosa]BBK33105.1 microcystinase C [Stella humosa]
MRLLIAMMKHETNTFSPVETGWQRFVEWGAHLGPAARAAYEGTAMPMGAYIELAKAAGAEIVTPVAAEAMPSGPVAAAAYDKMADAILDAAPGCDAALLDLHGAMVAENTGDGEGTLLERLRQRCPGLPIAVTLDLHCNLTQRMVDNCTAMIGYKTYPHTDMHVVGEQIGRVLMRSLKGEVAPVMAWGNRPILAQTLRMGTDDEPMRALIQLAREIETRPGILAATIFGGFPMADIPEAGISAVVVADGDQAAAQRAVDELLDAAWAEREEFAYRHEPIGQALGRAEALTDGPILLLDHADNCGSGGNQDVMTVLKAVMEQGLEDVAVAAVWDPVAVQELMQAGIGREVTIKLGGRTSMPAIGAQGEPLEVTGRVRTLSDGDWIVRGPMYTGVHVHMGPTAVLDTGKVKIVIVSRHHEPWDQGVFTSVGIDPASTRYLLLKSRIHYRAGFAPIARHTITLDGVGVTTSDNRILTYRNLRRPIYPLDPI